MSKRLVSPGDRFVHLLVLRVLGDGVEVQCDCGEVVTLTARHFNGSTTARYCGQNCALLREEKNARRRKAAPPAQHSVTLILESADWAAWSVKAALAKQPLPVYLAQVLARAKKELP